MRETRDPRASDQRGERMRGMRGRGTGTTEPDKAGAAARCPRRARVPGNPPRRGSEHTPDFSPPGKREGAAVGEAHGKRPQTRRGHWEVGNSSPLSLRPTGYFPVLWDLIPVALRSSYHYQQPGPGVREAGHTGDT